MISDAAIICSINGRGCPSDLIKIRAGILATITTGMIQLKISRKKVFLLGNDRALAQLPVL